MNLRELCLDIYVILFWGVMIALLVPTVILLSPIIVTRYLYTYLRGKP